MDTSPLFPLIVGRRGGAPVEILDTLCPSGLIDRMDRLEHLAQQQNLLKTKLTDAIYRVCGSTDNPGHQHILIQSKRELFNDRRLKFLPQLHNLLPRAVVQDLDQYLKQKEHREDLQNEFQQIYEDAITSAKEKLLNYSQLYFLRNGLLFSSADMLRQVQRIENGAQIKSKKMRRLTLSLLRYLSRSVAKTTPFSSFNQVFFLEATPSAYRPVQSPTTAGYLQFSNLFFHYLKELLMQQTAFRELLEIRNNTAIWQKGDRMDTFHFFLNEANHEGLKRIPAIEGVKAVHGLLTHNTLSFVQLLTKLEEKSGENRTTVRSFIEKLIAEGFLQLSYPVDSRNHNWMDQLSNFIKSRPLPNCSLWPDVLTVLLQLTNAIKELAQSQLVESRQKILNRLYHETTTFFKKWDTGRAFESKVKVNDLIYEDTSCVLQEQLPRKTFKDLSGDLRELFLHLNTVSPKKKLRQMLADQLKKKSIKRMPLLEFYHSVFLSINTDALLTAEDMEPFQTRLKPLLNVINSVDIIDLQALWTSVPVGRETINFGVHLQANDRLWQQVVINTLTDGCGSNISRFLNLLPDFYTQKIQQFNQAQHPDSLICDTRDASIHNLNNYPVSAPLTIDPTGKARNLLPLVKLWVQLDDCNQIKLIHEDGREVKAIHFSMEDLGRRSSLLQFLNIFHPTDLWGYQYFRRELKELAKRSVAKGAIVKIPRIMYGKRVTLQRRTWLVSRSDLMDSFSHRNEADVFLSIDKWRRKAGIPQQVFITIKQQRSSVTANDHYKPQYLDLRTPIFLPLLLQLWKSVEDYVEFTEVYPAVNTVKQQDGFVREYVINLST